MANMTGLGKYQRGLELEAEGLSAAQIVERLGYKDAQAWYAAKTYYKKQTTAFNARAAGKETDAAPIPEVEQINAEIAAQPVATTVAEQEPTERLKQKPQFAPKAIPGQTPESHARLKMEIQITAEGKALRYRLNNTQLVINRKGNIKHTFAFSIEEAMTMLEELKELLKL